MRVLWGDFCKNVTPGHNNFLIGITSILEHLKTIFCDNMLQGRAQGSKGNCSSLYPLALHYVFMTQGSDSTSSHVISFPVCL